MEQKVVLITGCSSGIGLSLAVQLASHPAKAYKVYATMRNLDKKQRLLESVRGLHKTTMDILQMDVTDRHSVLAARESITEGRVDIRPSGDPVRGHHEGNPGCEPAGYDSHHPGLPPRHEEEEERANTRHGQHGRTTSVSLIECGPVNTDFMRNMEKTDVSDESVEVDAHTRSLYETYLQHCQTVFQNAAQDTEDIIKVFVEAIQSPCPGLRYYTGSAVLPLSNVKLAGLDGSQYVRAVSKLIFSAGSADTQK